MQTSGEYTPIDEWNFAELTNDSEHSKYFKTIIKVFELFEKVHDLQQKNNDKDNFEFEAVKNFLKKFLTSIKALNLKYAYPTNRRIWLDLSESGFPNQLEFATLKKDITTAKDRVLELPTASIMARNLLDIMMSEYKQPQKLLKALGERTYLDYILQEKLFLDYTPGEELHHISTTLKGALFSYSFACYDFATNRPYIHYMTFSKDDCSKEFPKQLKEKFLDAVKLEGGRAAPLAVMASSLDETLEVIHPKTIRRLSIGPLYSRTTLNLCKPNESDSIEMQIREIFSRFPEAKNDFILFFSEEFLFSKKQQVKPRGILSMKQQIREIYEIDTLNPEAYDKKVSKLNYGVLLSHELLQNLSEDDKSKISHFNQAKIFVYNNDEVVYGI